MTGRCHHTPKGSCLSLSQEGDVVRYKLEDGKRHLVLITVTFKFIEADEELLAGCCGQAVDDGVLQGGGQCGGLEKFGVVE